VDLGQAGNSISMADDQQDNSADHGHEENNDESN
jgi:hypothetical protein